MMESVDSDFECSETPTTDSCPADLSLQTADSCPDLSPLAADSCADLSPLAADSCADLSPQTSDFCPSDPPPRTHALVDVADPKKRIYYMRNFNNWIKSILIGEFIELVRCERPIKSQINVLDLCCGKGGDLLKWKEANIDYLVCADIAATSVEQCESRYKENVELSKHERHGPRIYQADFNVADCTRARLRDLYREPDLQLDIVSCQFAFHFCFESHHQAEMMLQNAAESLRPGGYFIATTLDANELVKRWRAQTGNSFGNDVYQVTFFDDVKDDVPLFGARYDFSLNGSSKIWSEFLVHFPLLIKMAAEHGLELVFKKSFSDYFAENIQRSDHRSLLNIMQAMETYPADADKDLVGTDSDDYAHAKLRLQEVENRETTDSQQMSYKLGTLTKSEWEAITLYIVCAFRKVGDVTTDHCTKCKVADENLDVNKTP